MHWQSPRRAGHIAILLHDFSTGGTERIAIRLANRWVAAGRKVTIVCGTDEGPVRALAAAAIEVIALDPPIRRSPVSRWQLARDFAPVVERIAPDLIFAPGNFHLPVAGLLARRMGEDAPPLICKLSNPLHRRGRGPIGQLVFRQVLRTFSRPVDGFVAMSRNLHAEACRMLGPAWIDLIGEPILDTDGDIPGPPDATPLILCIGRLVAQKNFLRAIHAFEHVAARTDARLVILGEGVQRARLTREIDRIGLAHRVDMPGHVADVRPWLARARMLLISSDYEGYPAVAIEALAMHRPVVATRCSPAIEEFLPHPGFGRVVSDDPEAIAAAIVETLAAPLPGGRELAHFLDGHRIGKSAGRYLDLFDLAVRRRARRPIGAATCRD
jgi:glycosyltransferase involved in cell wall biosynthesis